MKIKNRDKDVKIREERDIGRRRIRAKGKVGVKGREKKRIINTDKDVKMREWIQDEGRRIRRGGVRGKVREEEVQG